MIHPATEPAPAFDITRASHIALTVADLGASLDFYREVIGLLLSARDGDTAWLRGVEETAHHSLILRQGPVAACDYLGYRVRDAGQIDRAERHLTDMGLSPRRVEVPEQGPSLRFSDPAGIPVELCARMSTLPRRQNRTASHRGAPALRYDHVQVQVPDVYRAAAFYTGLGFRISDCSRAPGDRLFSAFLHRKNNPHDLVLGCRRGPLMHHFAYVAETANLFRAGDIAADLGFGARVEYGPSRHGQDHAAFLYLRDPDGHRIELLGHPIQIVDAEDGTICRDVTERAQFVPWGPRAAQSYLTEASRFPGVEPEEATIRRTW